MNAVALLSGGLDSQVLLASIKGKYANIHCVGFDYGQKHKKELKQAAKIADYYKVSFEEIVLPSIKGSSLTGDGPVPKGIHFEDKKQSVTVVPNRNAVMLSMAASVAFMHKASVVVYAPHAGDSAVYPDCRPDFVEAIDRALLFGCGVSVIAPFLRLTKREVVGLGRELKVPLEMSWSCYEGGDDPCGACGACIERKGAMR